MNILSLCYLTFISLLIFKERTNFKFWQCHCPFCWLIVTTVKICAAIIETEQLPVLNMIIIIPKNVKDFIKEILDVNLKLFRVLKNQII